MFDHKTPEMKLELKSTALVFTDLQNDFLSPDGKAFSCGGPGLKKSFLPARSAICVSKGICGISSNTASKWPWFGTPRRELSTRKEMVTRRR